MRASLTKIGYTVVVLMAVVYAVFTLRGPHGVPAWMQKRQQIRVLEERNAVLARENQLKRERIERLKESQPEQEHEIRRRLKLVKPNEKVYILQDQDKKVPQ